MEVVAFMGLAVSLLIAFCIINIVTSLHTLIKLGQTKELIEQDKAKSLRTIAYGLNKKGRK